LFLLIRRLSRPEVVVMGRDPATGAWRAVVRNPDVETTPGVVTVRVEGPLFYANAETAKDGILAEVAAAGPVEAVVLDMGATEDLDVTSLDILGDLVDALAERGVRLELASVRAKVGEMLVRGGLDQRVTIWPTLDAGRGG
jgi:sulfate permease, SulP family